ncbi:MAG TPA: hypothetical protein VN759_09375 [Pseudolysinimonas sp.]|nr:hypothetical protein [Pseudolysinimonas sp.]
MTIDWIAFATVVVVTLVAAAILVTLFSVGLRLNDGVQRWRRPVAVAIFVVWGALVLFGIWLIVPAMHPGF